MDLKRGDTAGGVVPQETMSASGDNASTGHNASTGLDHTSDDHAIPMVSTVCVSCVLTCSVIYRRALDRPTMSKVSAQQTKHLPENASQVMPCLPKSIGPPHNA